MRRQQRWSVKTWPLPVKSLRLQHLFEDASLPVLFVKGAALAMLAFGNLSLRNSQDIDLLVNRETLPAAIDAYPPCRLLPF